MIDGSAAQLMNLSSELLAAQAQIVRQRRTIWPLVMVIRAERAASAALVDLLDSVLSDLDG